MHSLITVIVDLPFFRFVVCESDQVMMSGKGLFRKYWNVAEFHVHTWGAGVGMGPGALSASGSNSFSPHKSTTGTMMECPEILTTFRPP